MTKLSDNNIIHTFLNPKSVAVIGASKNPIKGGNRIVDNLVSNNFNGKVYPVQRSVNIYSFITGKSIPVKINRYRVLSVNYRKPGAQPVSGDN